VGYVGGTLINQIPTGGGQTVGDRISNALANVLFSGSANDTRAFIDAKVTTVLEHISRYAPPDPNDPDDKSRKKNIAKRMKKHLEAARNRLKRLRGNTKEQYAELIRRTEELLDRWIAGD